MKAHQVSEENPIDRVLAESARLRTVIEEASEELKQFSKDLLEASRVLRAEAGIPPDPGSAEDNESSTDSRSGHDG